MSYTLIFFNITIRWNHLYAKPVFLTYEVTLADEHSPNEKKGLSSTLWQLFSSIALLLYFIKDVGNRSLGAKLTYQTAQSVLLKGRTHKPIWGY